MRFNLKNIPTKDFLIILLFCLFILSCSDTINQPVETAFLDIVISTNDSVRVEYDDEIIIDGKLVFTNLFGFSEHIRMEDTEVGIHKIKFVVYDDSIEATRRFYIEDTMQIHIAYGRHMTAGRAQIKVGVVK